MLFPSVRLASVGRRDLLIGEPEEPLLVPLGGVLEWQAAESAQRAGLR
jgi:hypothetical protein